MRFGDTVPDEDLSLSGLNGKTTRKEI